MEHANPQYIAYTSLLDKRPIFYVQFGPIQSTELLAKNTSANPTLTLPQQFASGPIKNATLSRPNILTVPSSVTQQINPVGGSSTVGQVSFNLTDKGNIITNFLHNYTMKNRIVTIFGGYQELDEDQYRSLFTGVIIDFQLQNNTADYVFYVQDLNRYLHTGSTGSLFDASTSLVNPISNNPKDSNYSTAYVFGTNGFAPQTNMGRFMPPSSILTNGTLQTVSGVPVPIWNFIRVDDEIMGYTSVTPAKTDINNQLLPGSFGGLIRGEDISAYFPGYNAKASIVSHDAGASVTNFIQLGPINPIDLSLMLITSNTGTSANGPYDLIGWPSKVNAVPSGLNDQNQGCALPVQYVDVSGYISQKNQWFSDDKMVFFIENSVKASDFLANEIYTFENAFPIVKMNGQLSLAVYGNGSSPPTTNPYVFNDTNTIPGTLQWAANLQTNQGMYNYIEVNYDYDNIISESLTTSYNYFASSINETGEMAQLKLPSTGLRSSLNGNAIVKRFTNNLFQRYAFGAQKITFNSFYTGHLIDPGDFVLVEMSPLPNMKTGTRGGIPYTCQIIQKNINFQTGQIQYVALTTGVGGKNRNRGSYITPQSIFNGGTFPAYTSGTTFQQTAGYAFIALSGSPIPLQTDGSVGSFIMP